MEIADLVQNFKPGSEVDLRLQTEDAGDDRWNLYISAVSEGNETRYTTDNSIVKKPISDSPTHSSKYRKLLELGDMIEPAERDFTDFNPEDQFKLLMDYIEMNVTEHRPRTNIILHAYKELAKVIDALSDHGCDVTVAGSADKAIRVSSTYDTSA